MRNSQQDIGVPTGAPERTIAKVLAGQKALVTGANSGIGQAAAIALGQAGADVVVNYVTGEAQAVVDAIRRSGAEAYAHKADVSQEDQVEDMFRTRSNGSAPSISWSTTPDCSGTRRFTR